MGFFKKQDNNMCKWTIPRKVQDIIPVMRIYDDGMFLKKDYFQKHINLQTLILLWQVKMIRSLCLKSTTAYLTHSIIMLLLN